MCWKVTFGHHFDNNFWTVRNFWRCLIVFESTQSELQFEQKFCIFLMEIMGLLSFESIPPSCPKFGFQLCADGGAYKWKFNNSLTNLAWKYFSCITRSIILKSNFGLGEIRIPLTSDGGEWNWKSNDSHTNLAWKYFSYITRLIILKSNFV